MKKLQSFHLKEKYVKDIRKSIFSSIYKSVYAPVLKTIQEHLPLRNDSTDVIKAALMQGKISFYNNKFYGEWNAKLSKAFRDLNGRYDSRDNTWTVDNIPYDLQIAIGDADIMFRNIISSIGGIDFHFEPVAMTAYDKTADTMRKELWLTLLGISLIEPKEIETEPYINELNEAVSRYNQEEIERLLTFINLGNETLQDIKKSNNNLTEIYNYIEDRIEASKRKADFLAKNETNHMVNEYKMEEYKTNGITQYIWRSMEDEKVRPYHAALNGQIIDYDNPPVQDKYGNRAHAGQFFNCRCRQIPLYNK
jgi:SPP1 gp7 family putative phage head morphogenesis protein